MHRLGVALVCLLLLATAPAAPAPAHADAHGIAGVVTDAEGTPVPDGVVTLVAADDAGVVVGETTASADGSWRLEAADGEYRLHAADPSDELADAWWQDADSAEEADPVVVADGAGPQDVRFALAAAAAVEGTVRSPDGPVEGVVVRVERTPFSPVEATTDGQGGFRLAGLRAGTHAVEVEVGDRPLAPSTLAVDVEAGQVAEVVLDLRERPVGVERVAGEQRIATAVEASRRAFVTAPGAVLASAGSFPDALAASPLAASLGGPLLLVGRRLSPIVAEELARLGTEQVTIVGAIAAVPLVVQEDLRRRGIEVRRIAGEHRFDTAALIAREVGSADGRAILASGAAFPDALSVAPYAAAEGIPILLTPAERPHADTTAALAALGVTETLVVGGTAVVSDDVLRSLPAPTRVAGATRYETSLAVAEHWAARGMELGTVHVATGRDFPDALAAGPVAGLARGPILLVDGLDPARAADTYAWLAERREEITGAYAFGGATVMVDEVLQRLAEAIGS